MSKKITEVFQKYQENVKKKELLLEDINKILQEKIQIAIEEAQKKIEQCFINQDLHEWEQCYQ